MQNPYLPEQEDVVVPQATRRRIVLRQDPPVLMSFGRGFPHKIRLRKLVRNKVAVPQACLPEMFRISQRGYTS